MLNRVSMLLFTALSLAVTVSQATTPTCATYGACLRIANVNCGSSAACAPWEIGTGPYCARGGKMNLRFVLDVAPENYYLEYDNNTMTNVTYAFCPTVDELQAFNLTAGPLLGAMAKENATTYVLSNLTSQGFVSVYGFGGAADVLFPNATAGSESTALVIENGTDVCGSLDSIALVEFLVLSVSMDGGKFVYSQTSPQPNGVGFQPTCSGNVCSLDTTLPCIGPAGQKNCARCYSDPALLSNATIQIWTSYYGTDVNGRTLLSGASNPLNFQLFSGSGLYTNFRDSLDNIQTGNLNIGSISGSGPS